MKCKYNKHILCDRVKLICNGCSVEQAIMDERKRIKDILDKADTLVATEEVAKKLKIINK